MAKLPDFQFRQAFQLLRRSVFDRRWKRSVGVGAAAALLALTSLGVAGIIGPERLKASDHDDGDIDVRSRALSLTDLYFFRERDQNPNARADDLILVMNTNPRSLARQPYFFSNAAQYEFKISRVGNVNGVPTTVPDLTLRFTFTPAGNPQGVGSRQGMTLTVIDRNGRTTTINRSRDGKPLLTTPITAGAPSLNQVNINGNNVTIFAGLREDPFFFDVEQFFRVRAGLAGFGPRVGFRSPETAQDFTKGYNVNTIVMRVPRRLLQGNTNAQVFDAWLAINIRDPRTGRFVQTEQLANPGINEALLISQKNLAAYNRLQPTRTVTPELLQVATEAKASLRVLGNSSAQADALLGAFLPDVMRNDTRFASGFGTGLNSRGTPVRGRKLQDDVIDVALTVLTRGAVRTDNVSYQGTPGNAGQGHQPLAPSFPYLAPPN